MNYRLFLALGVMLAASWDLQGAELSTVHGAGEERFRWYDPQVARMSPWLEIPDIIHVQELCPETGERPLGIRHAPRWHMLPPTDYVWVQYGLWKEFGHDFLMSPGVVVVPIDPYMPVLITPSCVNGVRPGFFNPFVDFPLWLANDRLEIYVPISDEFAGGQSRLRYTVVYKAGYDFGKAAADQLLHESVSFDVQRWFHCELSACLANPDITSPSFGPGQQVLGL